MGKNYQRKALYLACPTDKEKKAFLINSRSVGQQTLSKAYRGETYFHGKRFGPSDHLIINLIPPVDLISVLFVSGHSQVGRSLKLIPKPNSKL